MLGQSAERQRRSRSSAQPSRCEGPSCPLVILSYSYFSQGVTLESGDGRKGECSPTGLAIIGVSCHIHIHTHRPAVSQGCLSRAARASGRGRHPLARPSLSSPSPLAAWPSHSRSSITSIPWPGGSASAVSAGGTGIVPCFPRPIQACNSKTDTPVATLPDAWCNRVSGRNSRPGVTLL